MRFPLAFKIILFYIIGFIWGLMVANLRPDWWWGLLVGGVIGYWASELGDEYD